MKNQTLELATRAALIVRSHGHAVARIALLAEEAHALADALELLIAQAAECERKHSRAGRAGRKPEGAQPLTNAERQKRKREKKKRHAIEISIDTELN